MAVKGFIRIILYTVLIHMRVCNFGFITYSILLLYPRLYDIRIHYSNSSAYMILIIN